MLYLCVNIFMEIYPLAPIFNLHNVAAESAAKMKAIGY